MARTIKEIGRPRNEPISVWKEKDSIDKNEVTALVMILDGPGCSWSRNAGCTMCGYCNDVDRSPVTGEEMLAQVRSGLERYVNEPYVKIFTSGSFLDPAEIPHDVQIGILSMISDINSCARVLIESRPEFISGGSLKGLVKEVDQLEIAVGLESSSDIIRNKIIRKGFTFKQYLDAGKIVIDNGCLLKSYLLLKPPMIGEALAMDDMLSSISDIHSIFPGSRISINPMNIQSGTPVETLFEKGNYRPPWLWTLLKVLEMGSDIAEGVTHLMSSPTGGGKRRGAHNCGICDPSVLGSIRDFSISNRGEDLLHPMDCCSDEWRRILEISRLDPLVPDTLRSK